MSERVEITQRFVGVCFMQVCAVDDATDEEILKVCNRDNPAGTTNGWGGVVRDDSTIAGDKGLPVACGDTDGRTHFLVYC